MTERCCKYLINQTQTMTSRFQLRCVFKPTTQMKAKSTGLSTYIFLFESPYTNNNIFIKVSIFTLFYFIASADILTTIKDKDLFMKFRS